MRIILPGLCALALALTCAQAQPPVRRSAKITPEQAATRQTEKMKENLSLSEKQYKKIYKLNLKQAKKTTASQSAGTRPMGPPPGGRPDRSGMRPDQGDRRGGAPGVTRGEEGKSREQRGNALREAPPIFTEEAPCCGSNREMEQREKRLRKILTDEQYAKWSERKRERKGQLERGPRKGRPSPERGRERGNVK